MDLHTLLETLEPLPGYNAGAAHKLVNDRPKPPYGRYSVRRSLALQGLWFEGNPGYATQEINLDDLSVSFNRNHEDIVWSLTADSYIYVPQLREADTLTLEKGSARPLHIVDQLIRSVGEEIAQERNLKFRHLTDKENYGDWERGKLSKSHAFNGYLENPDRDSVNDLISRVVHCRVKLEEVVESEKRKMKEDEEKQIQRLMSYLPLRIVEVKTR